MSLFDVIYVTRVQKERFSSEAEFAAVGSSYQITAEALKKARADALVMHPLPRVDELAYGIDRDPRAVYFRQAAYGVPVRMALASALLGLRAVRIGKARKGEYKPKPRREVDFRKFSNVRCSNGHCVTNHETYLAPQFNFVDYAPGAIACAYCEHEMPMPAGVPSE